MHWKTIAMTGFAVVATSCADTPELASRFMTIEPAPVSFDGHVARQATDYVFVLMRNVNPKAPGLSLRAGESLRVVLHPVFKRNATVAISTDTDANLVLTKGWPQGAVGPADRFHVGFDEKSNSMTVRALHDIAADGMNSPGIKMIHLRGRTFTNPLQGEYDVSVLYTAANGETLAVWRGRIEVLAEAPAARVAPSNFHLPPGTNANFQQVSAGQNVPRPLGVLLWGGGGAPLNGVGIAPRDLTRFPKYTGGLLVQDSNADRRLDPAIDKVVGGIIDATPQGATGQSATSPIAPDGTIMLSGEVLRNAGFTPQMGGGKPNSGLLAIQFRAGDKEGHYRPTVELIGGNSYRFTVEVPIR